MNRESKKQLRESKQNKNQFFEKINKIDKLSASLTKRKERGLKLPKSEMKEGLYY